MAYLFLDFLEEAETSREIPETNTEADNAINKCRVNMEWTRIGSKSSPELKKLLNHTEKCNQTNNSITKMTTYITKATTLCHPFASLCTIITQTKLNKK